MDIIIFPESIVHFYSYTCFILQHEGGILPQTLRQAAYVGPDHVRRLRVIRGSRPLIMQYKPHLLTACISAN